jgi:peptide/nickel transport system substrate-binding protein
MAAEAVRRGRPRAVSGIAAREEPMLRIAFLFAFLVPLGGIPAAQAQPADGPVPRAETLVMGMGAPVTAIDPHVSNAAPNSTIGMHIFDRLVERRADSHLVPGLAASWRPVSDTVWEFHLRPGVRWQDGVAFTADDVAFTYARVPQVTNTLDSLAGYLRDVAQVEVVDPLTLLVHTRAPAPDLPGALATIAIIARHAATGAGVEDFNDGRAAIGTGPYRLLHFTPGDRVSLARNDDWWGARPRWARVEYRPIANPGARVAALLAGDVDIIDLVAPSDAAVLRRDARVRVASVQGLRGLHLALDTLRPTSPWITDAEGKPLPANPLRDRRVRQALSVAINRTALCDNVLEGGAVPNGQFVPPGSFGYDRDVKVPPYDPALARRLLAEAGYPHGFRITVHTPNDRFFNDAATVQAVAQMWTRVGVATQVEAMPWNSYAGKGVHRGFAVSLWAWGNNTGEAGATLLNVVGSRDAAIGRGSYNNGGYASEALDGLVDRALRTVDADAREAVLRQAVRMEADDVAVIHLYQALNFWATRRDLAYEPRMDQRTLARFVTPVAP